MSLAALKETDSLEINSQFASLFLSSTWKLIEKENRSEEENLRMIGYAHASLIHIRQLSDYTSADLSAGYWQVSRAYALIGEVGLAKLYGEKSLELTSCDDFFNRAFAHEAIARAEMIARNFLEMDEQLVSARQCLSLLHDQSKAKWLTSNLKSISRSQSPLAPSTSLDFSEAS